MSSETRIGGTIEVREATPEDLESIAAFNEAMALETEGKRLDPGTIRAGVRHLYERPELGFYLVATSPELPAAGALGCLLVTFEWSDWRDGLFLWIQSVYVRPEVRGRGAFAALYREVERRARARDDVRGLRLYVERENLRAQRTYARLGMQETAYRLWETELRPTA